MDQNQDCSSALLYIENMIIPNGHTYEEFLEHLKTKKTNGIRLEASFRKRPLFMEYGRIDRRRK